MRDEWITQAASVAVVFAQNNYEFTGEELSKYLEQQVGPPPKDSMYGYVLRTILSANDLILPVGFTKAKKKSAKGRRVTRWRSTVCKGEHSTMAVRETLLAIRVRFNTRHLTLEEALYEAYKAGLGSTEMEG